LTDLITNLDAKMVSRAITNAVNISPEVRSDPRLPIPGYSMFEVLWIKVLSILDVMPILEIPMWTNINGGEYLGP
jgi:hypothetical protein